MQNTRLLIITLFGIQMIAESDRELRANAASDTRGSVLDLLFVVLEQAMTRVLITAHHAIIATMVEHLAHQTIVHHLVTRELAGRVRALVNDLQTQLPGVLKAITATNSAAPTSELTLTWLLVSIAPIRTVALTLPCSTG
jgi:hypothetical protein